MPLPRVGQVGLQLCRPGPASTLQPVPQLLAQLLARGASLGLSGRQRPQNLGEHAGATRGHAFPQLLQVQLLQASQHRQGHSAAGQLFHPVQRVQEFLLLQIGPVLLSMARLRRDGSNSFGFLVLWVHAVGSSILLPEKLKAWLILQALPPPRRAQI